MRTEEGNRLNTMFQVRSGRVGIGWDGDVLAKSSRVRFCENGTRWRRRRHGTWTECVKSVDYDETRKKWKKIWRVPTYGGDVMWERQYLRGFGPICILCIFMHLYAHERHFHYIIGSSISSVIIFRPPSETLSKNKNTPK